MRVNDATAPDLETLVGDWLTVPDLAEALGMSLRQVRQMIADREIIASRVGERNVVAVPAAFIQGGGYIIASLSPLGAGLLRDHMADLTQAWVLMGVGVILLGAMTLEFRPGLPKLR